MSVREQLSVLIQIGNINHKMVQFLFPDLNPEGIVIPIGVGTGLIQAIDNEHPYQDLPLLCPTYYTKKGILWKKHPLWKDCHSVSPSFVLPCAVLSLDSSSRVKRNRTEQIYLLD